MTTKKGKYSFFRIIAERKTNLHIPGFRFVERKSFTCGEVRKEVDIYQHELTQRTFVLVPGGGNPDEIHSISPSP